MEKHVSLNRQFSPISKSQEEKGMEETLTLWGQYEPKTWSNLVSEFRCVIKAEAGAGKTEELRHQAELLTGQGKPTFFIRIEDIETDFFNAFEIGSEDEFQSWLSSTEEAWFFLDSVDEARLENPRTFEKALRRFAKGIKNGEHRAHIYVSSRPYAWRPVEDRGLMDEILFSPLRENDKNNVTNQTTPKSALTVYSMLPLDRERIRSFCNARSVENVDLLLQEIDRAGIISLAEIPFDLEGILSKWAEVKVLGSRLDLLQHNITKRLSDDHNTDRASRQPLNQERARKGARRLAAAVVLSGKAGINVPDAKSPKPGIDAESVLSEWDPKEVRALLERGIFNDIIYGAVRFRHRDIRELLAAEWFDELLKSGSSCYSIESLFFREQYGEKIIPLRLRKILPWLILFDNSMRVRTLELYPEIAVEGGDPSKLPLEIRKEILNDIVRRISEDEDVRSARDNSAIAKIAKSDLSDETLNLIHTYSKNDDAIFFLGRLVWQGEMTSCVYPFVDIAINHSRGIYARIASIRAIMTCGTTEVKIGLWEKLVKSSVVLPRDLLAEIVEWADSDIQSIMLLQSSLANVQPYERYTFTSLQGSFNEYVERFKIHNNRQGIVEFIEGLHGFLSEEPFVERGDCHVSKEYAWLINPAIHMVERLIKEKNPVALSDVSISILLMVPALRFWDEVGTDQYKDSLNELVPDWIELNDKLYWASIEQARKFRSEKSKEPLRNDGPVSWVGHFWKFDEKSLSRVLEFVKTKSLHDDKMVALSTAFRIYLQNDKPDHILNQLNEVVSGDSALKDQLDNLLNPPVSESEKKYEEEYAERRKEQGKRDEKNRQNRERWRAELRASPNRIRNPEDLEPGVFTDDQYWLFRILLDTVGFSSRADGANWEALIPEFGEEVANAYKDAAINHWRFYKPSLQSEGVLRENSTAYSLIFAMVGLEIESTEAESFPSNLSEAEANHALRYITWELNGFPSWLEKMFKAFPELVIEAIKKELIWELMSSSSNQSMNYILHDLVYHATWLNESVAPIILDWIEENPQSIDDNRDYFVQILINGGIVSERLADIAIREIKLGTKIENIAWWYALLIDCIPEKGIPKLGNWLSGLKEQEAKRASLIFITALMGGNHSRNDRPILGNFKTVEHLKSLYILMHRYIKAEEDTNRGTGAFSPELRDDAQRARSRLLDLLGEISGKESYIALKELVEEHPDPSYRPWMDKRAHKKAELDGELEFWTSEQVSTFARSQLIIPHTHRQLFDLGVNRFLDLKNWLEQGNDSPWKTWQRAGNETEMRTLVTGWLNQQSKDKYTTAMEPEIANRQRMDIWLNNTNVDSPVPIELKLLDKSWSGPKLCERLRNQLVGDYLREKSAGFGVMLLIGQCIPTNRRWIINNKRVGINGLAEELKSYWHKISGNYPDVEGIDVIVIDLNIREHVSKI